MGTRRGVRLTRKSGTTVWAGDYATVPSGVTIDGNAARMDLTTLNCTAGSLIGTTVKSSGTAAAGTTTTSNDFTLTGKVDLGCGTHYKYDSGDEPLTPSKDGSGGTSLSAGTMQVATNLTTVVGFWPSRRTTGPAGVTVGHHNIPQHLGWTVSATDPSDVTVTLCHNRVGVLSGVTGNATLVAGGVTLHWFAIGT
jgi:hypothetical protein